MISSVITLALNYHYEHPRIYGAIVCVSVCLNVCVGGGGGASVGARV